MTRHACTCELTANGKPCADPGCIYRDPLVRGAQAAERARAVADKMGLSPPLRYGLMALAGVMAHDVTKKQAQRRRRRRRRRLPSPS